MKPAERMTVPALVAKKARGEKIVCLTAYDWLFASILDSAGVDLVLVGDSAAMVFAGHETTLPMTMDQMVYHASAVARGVERALVIADMPFLSYRTDPAAALANAGRLLAEARAGGVKVEGGGPVAETVRRMTGAGIPVMGHLGLTPQSIRAFGEYGVRGLEAPEAEAIRSDARRLEDAGAFSLVLEKVPSALAAEVAGSLSIPVIGIGAGPACDGQVLVTPDLLGLFERFKPKFARRYADLAGAVRSAAARFSEDVRACRFPSEEESY